MPQLNFLPVNISQNADLKDEAAPLHLTKSKSDFSQYIDQHLTKNKEGEGVVSIDDIKSEANSAKKLDSKPDPQGERKKLDDSSDKLEVTDEESVADASSVSLQKVAADGNKPQIEPSKKESNKAEQKALFESEQLMSFLNKADNTLLNQSIDTSSVISPSEPVPSVQKVNNEVALLLNASHLVADLSAVAKAIEQDQADVMLTPRLSSTLTEQLVSEENAELNNVLYEANKESNDAKLSSGVSPILIDKLVPAAELAINSGIKNAIGEGSKDKLFVESVQDNVKDQLQTETPIISVKANENKAVLTDSETNSTPELKVARTNSDKIKLVQPISSEVLSSQTKPSQAVPAKSLVENDLETINLEDVLSTEEQKITNQLNKQVKTDQVQMSNAQIDQNALPKTVFQTSEQESLNLSQSAENAAKSVHVNEKINPIIGTQANNTQAQADAVKPLGNVNDLMTKKVNQTEQIEQEIKFKSSDSQLVKNESVQSSEKTALNKKSNQAVVNINTTALSNNQISDSDVNAEEVKQASVNKDEKAQLSAFLSDQSQQKSVANNGTLIDDKVMVGAKNGISFNTNTNTNTNTSFIDVTGKAVETAQDIIDQQSVEMLNPSVSTEAIQSQKTNTQLHQETISLFRKDFADAVKDKVMLMISQKLQRFDITLDPPELGNMQVRVNLQGEQAAVNFIVQSQQTKDALEQNMHKLRDSLAEQGVDVGDANVEQQSQQSANGEENTAGYNNQMEDKLDNMAEAHDVVTHSLSAQMIDSSTASVDYYA